MMYNLHVDEELTEQVSFWHNTNEHVDDDGDFTVYCSCYDSQKLTPCIISA
jgi:hypothetical protein